MANDTSYRPDIDGLRAIAVAMVVVFHIFGVLDGGFIGVDVFFVISGFLITGILLREASGDGISIARFYERRIRRIMPALLVVLATSTVAATIMLLPSDLIGFGKSALSTVLFVSNFYFWRDSDYFATLAETKPLLHTWSLGIEEQFYIFFPLLIAVAVRFGGRRLALASVAIVTMMSFALTVAIFAFGKGNIAFYLPPFRIWELGVGALVAFTTSNERHPRGSRALRTIAASVGLLLVLLFALDGDWYRLNPIPVVLPAVIGTAMLIWAGGSTGNPVSRAIGNRAMTLLGLMSYSIYLWHWPLNVFAKYWLIRPATFTEQLLILATTMVCSVLSWRYVERPFRGGRLPTRRVLAIAGAGTALVAAVAVGLIMAHGFPQRLPARAERYNRVAGTNFRCSPSDLVVFGSGYACTLSGSGDPASATIALLGDSYAQMYGPAVAKVAVARHVHSILVPANGCLPAATFNTSTSCATLFAANRDALLTAPGPKVVVIASAWENMEKALVDRDGRPVGVDRWERLERDLSDTIARFNAAGKQVALVSPIATPGYDISSAAGRAIAFGRPLTVALSTPRSDLQRRFGQLTRWMQSRPGGATFIDTSRYLCDALTCHFTVDDTPVFADGGHLSYFYVERMAPAFEAVVTHSVQ